MGKSSSYLIFTISFTVPSEGLQFGHTGSEYREHGLQYNMRIMRKDARKWKKVGTPSLKREKSQLKTNIKWFLECEEGKNWDGRKTRDEAK